MLTEAGMLAFLVLFAGASAIDSSLTFSFLKQPSIFRKNADICRMCYGKYDCLTMDKARCEYNAETAAIFHDGDGRESSSIVIKLQVDTLLNDLTLKESIMEKYEECIPIISSYTDCNRENICSGCRTCDCTLEGKWNCTLVQHCRAEKTEVNHRVLVFVMEKLKSDPKPFRAKRETYYEKSSLQTANFEELLNWFYEETAPELKIAHMKEPSTKTKRDSENAPTIIQLDDVLNVIGLDTNDSSTGDAVSPNHIDNPDSSKDIVFFLQMLALEEGKEATAPSLDATAKVIVNFSNDNNSIDTNTNIALDTDSLNKNGTNEKLNKKVLLQKDFNVMDNLDFINFMNVMKRDINQVNKTFENTTVDAKNISVNLKDKPLSVKNIEIGGNNINMALSEKVLQNDVLDAISILIKNKYKEIEQLSDIKESLNIFMKNYNFNSTKHYKSKSLSKNINPLFKPEVNLYKHDNFRRYYSVNNIDQVEEYSKKLNIDLKEVVRDILEIRKYQKSKVLSNELKLLLQAITYFFRKNSAMPEENKNITSFIRKLKNFRRQFSPTNINTSLNPVLTAVLKILEVIDKDMPISNALGPLSPKANKVLKRIVNRNYVDDFAFTVNGHDNLTTDLNSVGLNWQKLTLNIIVNCAPAERLHNMKLLYLTLSKNIMQLKDASATSDFFCSRRMSLTDEMERKAIMHRINTDLNRVDNIIRHYKKEKVINANKTKQKLSLFKKIKGLWKTSKNDLINILRKRTKPHVVKEMERKKMENEKTQSFLEIVQKWQDNLDIVPFRNKRSIREYTKLKNRMKNIIPHYLRGKLHPALSAKGMGVRKKPITYKMRPKSPAHPAAKVAISTAKPRAVKLNKIKQKH